MKNEIVKKYSDFLIFKTEDEKISVDVRLEDETVWLTIDAMAQLFEKSRSTINEHILNIYEEGELQESDSVRKIGISDFSTKVVLTSSHHIKNRTRENVGKSSANILYNKKYKMSHPIFASIFSLLPTHAQPNNPAILRGTKYLYDYMPLPPNRQSLSRQQGIILIKTANAVLAICSYLKILYFCRRLISNNTL